MRLEFLQTEEDIREFLDFLYGEDAFLVRRGQILSEESAFDALSLDLLLAGGVYDICKDGERLLTMNSCSRDSHPRKLGKKGRQAGMISEISSSENATILIRQIKKYFSKHYTRAHYNGAARMVCYFGEHYAKLDAEYQNHPEKDNICPGLIHILFQDDRFEEIRSTVTKTLAVYPAIEIVEITEGKDWQQPERNEMRVVLSCDHSAFCFDDLKRIMLELNGNQKADAFKTKLVLAAMTYHDPLTGPQKTAIHICVENPWQCWIGRENEFSGNRVIIWPEK